MSHSASPYLAPKSELAEQKFPSSIRNKVIYLVILGLIWPINTGLIHFSQTFGIDLTPYLFPEGNLKLIYQSLLGGSVLLPIIYAYRLAFSRHIKLKQLSYFSIYFITLNLIAMTGLHPLLSEETSNLPINSTIALTALYSPAFLIYLLLKNKKKLYQNPKSS